MRRYEESALGERLRVRVEREGERDCKIIERDCEKVHIKSRVRDSLAFVKSQLTGLDCENVK